MSVETAVFQVSDGLGGNESADAYRDILMAMTAQEKKKSFKPFGPSVSAGQVPLRRFHDFLRRLRNKGIFRELRSDPPLTSYF